MIHLTHAASCCVPFPGAAKTAHDMLPSFSSPSPVTLSSMAQLSKQAVGLKVVWTLLWCLLGSWLYQDEAEYLLP